MRPDVARNILQTAVDNCKGHKGQLAGLSSFVADLMRSLDASRLHDQDDPERVAYLDKIKAELREGHAILNKAARWA